MAYVPKKITSEDCDGNEHELPTIIAICSVCEGRGTSSAYLGAITRDTFDEDPEFKEDYMNGLYDRACDNCEGSGRVTEVDRDRADPVALKLYDETQEDLRQMRAEQYSEWLHEGGWRELGWR